jgi:hypothetical protein
LVWDNAPVDISDKQLEIDLRATHDQLYREICLVRTHGMRNLTDVLSKLPGLLDVARLSGSGTDDADKIEDVLRRAVQRLGGMGTAAIEALFGTTRETRGLSVKERRERAAQLYDYKAYEFFRTRIEPSLLMFMATYLHFLADKQHLAKWEQDLSGRENFLAHSEHVFDGCPLGKDGSQQAAVNPEPDELPSIYHLLLEPGDKSRGYAYSLNCLRVSVEIEDREPHSKIRNFFNIPNRRYRLETQSGSHAIAGFYRAPHWLKRTYRRLILRFM